jgi:NADPH2:quinone reductase
MLKRKFPASRSGPAGIREEKHWRAPLVMTRKGRSRDESDTSSKIWRSRRTAIARTTATEAGVGEVLVRVQAAGVNCADIYFRNGALPRPIPFPFTLGIEGPGEIEAVGEGVSELKRGDRVAYKWSLGSYAEYDVVKAAEIAPLPDEVSFDDCAAIILQGLTAHYLVHEFYPIKRGSTVLVHAAAGGKGLLLVQWVKHMGAVVIGTVSTDEKAKIAGEAGADNVILYTKQDFAEEVKKLTGGAGVEHVIDGVLKTTIIKNLDALKPRGWATIFGMASGPADPLVPNSLMMKSLTISGGAFSHYTVTRDEILRRARDVFAGLREGWLKLCIDRTFQLAQAAEAHQLLESRQTPVNDPEDSLTRDFADDDVLLDTGVRVEKRPVW